MKVALFEYDIIWENPQANFDFIQKYTEGLDVDILLIPEMFSTGFSMNLNTIAEEPLGKSYQFLKFLSKRLDLSISATIPVKEDGKYYNRLYWIQNNEIKFEYNKRHLFSYGKEDQYFSAGEKAINLEYKSWTISPMICYDLRFPVWCRNQASHDFQFFLANWPSSRITHWKKLLQARAIENLCFVAGVNRLGTDGNKLEYDSSTYMINPNGEIMNGKSFNEFIKVYEITKEELDKTRIKFGFLRDKDEYELRDRRLNM